MRAFVRALEVGADGIELDIHGTRDGVLVVHHDAELTLQRGEATERIPLEALLWAEVREHLLPSGDPIPSLAEVFERVGQAAHVYVEVKAPHQEVALVALLDSYPTVRASVHAFDHRIPVRVRALRPHTPIGLLSASYPLDVGAQLALATGATLWQQATLIDEALVRAVHAAGSRIIAWTQNHTPHARQLASWGVDALCTDIPGALRAALQVEPMAAETGA